MSDNNNQFKNLNDRIDAKILEKRRLFICDAVTQESAHEIIRKLWYLELIDPGKPILLVINSPGGSVDAGFAIWDQVQLITSPVTTLITGLAASMGSVLSLCAAPGKSYATSKSRIMIHQPLLSGVIQGQATDLEIQAKEIIKTRNLLCDIYVKKTGKTFEEIEKAIDRDTWMTAEEAIEFGLLDGIITSLDELN
ncbi:MAG: ATP-dependent Clp protease proteolytic subunit [Chlamydiota bacterium]